MTLLAIKTYNGFEKHSSTWRSKLSVDVLSNLKIIVPSYGEILAKEPRQRSVGVTQISTRIQMMLRTGLAAAYDNS